MSTIEQILERDGVLVYKTKGRSMEPMLRQDRDLVTVRVPSSRLHKYDVALYLRGKDYVLHRVIGVDANGYRIRGDNTWAVERVPKENVIGVLTGFQRNGRDHSVRDLGYRIYARSWNVIYPVRVLVFRLRHAAVWIARRTGILPLLKKVIGRE